MKITLGRRRGRASQGDAPGYGSLGPQAVEALRERLAVQMSEGSEPEAQAVRGTLCSVLFTQTWPDK